ncbi:HDOD domain-containing protein [Thermodesulforhabdus norvegica]|uniref:HDIG domain-containing protein n=1 Tax=Thermodesulforhabdus norvegica TaxID=39841 RepID=A0A1I4W1S1_9BACT|nr:HDOD domain-containing protein [Thermodesulforhabdus norvegica]SFN07422.1 HDIG domain-containing protein [Thermodesulforhabdus norvegica]
MSDLVKQIIAHADQLPPFPDIVQKVMPLLQRMAPVRQIEEVIQYDPAIAARVIAISRSPYYARRHSVGSLRDAIVALGQKQLIQVVMAACAARYYQGRMEGYDLREGELWEHAVGVAIMTTIVSERLNRKNILTLYTAGLLHDIGKTVLHFYVKDDFEKIISLVKNKSLHFLDAEREVLGIDHQQLGGIIAKKWNFPEPVVAAIRYHHEPLKVAPKYQEITKIVHVANIMVAAMGIGCGVDGMIQPHRDQVFQELKITTRMSEEMLAEFGDQFRALREFLSA